MSHGGSLEKRVKEALRWEADWNYYSRERERIGYGVKRLAWSLDIATS